MKVRIVLFVLAVVAVLLVVQWTGAQQQEGAVRSCWWTATTVPTTYGGFSVTGW